MEILCLDFTLIVEDILKEWVVERMIIIIKEMEQWRPEKYNKLTCLLRERYQQLVRYFRSDDFLRLDISEVRKHHLLIKI